VGSSSTPLQKWVVETIHPKEERYRSPEVYARESSGSRRCTKSWRCSKPGVQGAPSVIRSLRLSPQRTERATQRSADWTDSRGLRFRLSEAAR